MLVGDKVYFKKMELYCAMNRIPFAEMISPESNYYQQIRKLQMQLANNEITADMFQDGVAFQNKLLKKKYKK